MLGSLALNLGLLMLCWGGVAMAFGAVYRRTVASAVTGLLAFAALLLDITGRLWPPANGLSMMGTIDEFYRALVATGEIERDPGQESVVEKLIALEVRLAQQRWAQKSSPPGWLFVSHPAGGLYEQ